MKALCLLFITASLPFLLRADSAGEVRELVKRIDEAARDGASLSRFFTSTADYRDATGVDGGPAAAAVTELLRQEAGAWTERSRPMLQTQSVRLLDAVVAVVDAAIVQYGSTMGKASMPVVLIAVREREEWKVAAWRTMALRLSVVPLIIPEESSEIKPRAVLDMPKFVGKAELAVCR